jgi:hypothetical protein
MSGIFRKVFITGVLRSSNEDNGPEKWHFIEADIEIELVQRLPDKVRALK